MTPPRLSGTAIDQTRPDAPALAAFGAHPIGVRTLRFTDPGRLDLVQATATAAPAYDRSLTVEVWYPAPSGTAQGGSYRTLIRDGQTEATLTGRAARDAPAVAGTTFPLVIISHGYPGNRFLLSHFAENLASKGFVAVAIDHTDSLYQDVVKTGGNFGSTLLNRPIDQRFILDRMASLGDTAPHLAPHLAPDLAAIIDAGNTGVIGYSMGGYGALVFGGAGLSEAALTLPRNTAGPLLAQHRAGSASHAALVDPRVKAVLPIGPWGMAHGLWDAAGLAGLRKPMFLMAGSADDISDYPSIRAIYEGATNAPRHLLTFHNANHNAAAPIPAPPESWAPSPALDFVPFEHYADPVWDTLRMNNIAQHFATAFLSLHLKGDATMAPHLDPAANWPGFAPRTTAGLRLERLHAGQTP